MSKSFLNVKIVTLALKQIISNQYQTIGSFQ